MSRLLRPLRVRRLPVAVERGERPEDAELQTGPPPRLRGPYQGFTAGSTTSRADSYRGFTAVDEPGRIVILLTAALALADTPTSTNPIVVESHHGFDWTAAGLGAVAGFGLALALVGSISS